MDFLFKKNMPVTGGDLLFFPHNGNTQKIEYVKGNERIIVLGDLISDVRGEELKSLLFNSIRNDDIYKFSGFFYLIYVNSDQDTYKIYSCLFNILPIYYYYYDDEIIVSSKISLIKEHSKRNFETDKRYILERTIFNYGFFNRTYWKYINLVPANSSVSIKGNLTLVNLLRTEDLFVTAPVKGKRELENLTWEFISSCSKYFRKNNFAVSFTSGFDGRTLVSAAKSYNKDFFTYSFGNENSGDVVYPFEQSKKLNIPYMPVLLDRDYIENHSFNCGISLIELTEGAASFGRAHYLFAAKTLSGKSDCIITGNFGSELFRAFHNSGVMFSSELINFFEPGNDNWIDKIKHSERLKYLSSPFDYRNEMNELINDLSEYKKSCNFRNANRFFYVFLLEEIFRKYFGPEIVMQQNYLNNRCPFLDFSFIQKLFATIYSGVYSDFMTSNPVKRFKGQLLYAYIIKETYPVLLYYNTGKGYKPADLLSVNGKFKIVKSRFLKSSDRFSPDPYSVKKSFEFNKELISGIELPDDLYNSAFIKESINHNHNSPDDLILVLSSCYYLSKRQEKLRLN